MKLPPEAIEAAAQALAHCAAGEHFTPDDPELDRQSWLPDARAALSAALPFLTPTRDQVKAALHTEGAFCGECDYPEDDCAACDRVLDRYADAVLALFGGATNE